MKWISAIILFLYATTLLADYRSDYVELSGKVVEFNEDYVTLFSSKNAKAYAPRSAVSNEQLRAKGVITVDAPTVDYLKVVNIIKKKNMR